MGFPVDEPVSIFRSAILMRYFPPRNLAGFSPYSPPTHSPGETPCESFSELGILTRLGDDSDEERLTTPKETSIHERLDEVGFDAGVFLSLWASTFRTNVR